MLLPSFLALLRCTESGSCGLGTTHGCVRTGLQVAAHADSHIRVAKASSADGRRLTAFQTLDTLDQRVAEVAAMLGTGAEDVARQLFEQAAGTG
jgi:DNA repair ATPase RecN